MATDVKKKISGVSLIVKFTLIFVYCDMFTTVNSKYY